MKKYYSLSLSADARIIGTFAQVSCITQFQAHQLSYGKFPGFNPELKFKMEKKAKVTDFLSQASISASGFLINEKTRAILDRYKIIDHAYYPVQVEGGNKKESLLYYWLHLVSQDANLAWIDFPKSKFQLERGLGNFEDLRLNSPDEYEAKLDEIDNWDTLGTIWLKQAKLTTQFDPDLALFTFPQIDTNIYVEQSLGETLLNQGVTGIEMKEASIV